MKNIIEYIFPKKSKWIDISTFDNGGNYYLIQMRYTLNSNKKQFRNVKIGFINDYTQKLDIYKNILNEQKLEESYN